MDEYDDDDGYDDQFTATYNGPSDWQGVEVHGQSAQAEDQDPENVEDKLDKNWPDQQAPRLLVNDKKWKPEGKEAEISEERGMAGMLEDTARDDDGCGLEHDHDAGDNNDDQRLCWGAPAEPTALTELSWQVSDCVSSRPHLSSLIFFVAVASIKYLYHLRLQRHNQSVHSMINMTRTLTSAMDERGSIILRICKQCEVNVFM